MTCRLFRNSASSRVKYDFLSLPCMVVSNVKDDQFSFEKHVQIPVNVHQKNKFPAAKWAIFLANIDMNWNEKSPIPG